MRRKPQRDANRDFLGWQPCLANPIEHLPRSKPLLRSRLLHSSPAHSQAMHMQAGSQSSQALLTGSYRRVSGRSSSACARASRRSCLSFRPSRKWHGQTERRGGDPRNGRAHGHRRLHLRPSAGPARSATDAVLQYRLFVLLPLEPPLDRAHEPRDAGAHLPARVREPAARPAARGGVAWR